MAPVPEPSAAFAALGDPVRMDLVRALLDGPERSSVLADRVGATRSTTSKHLRVLADAGLVQAVVVPEDHRGRRYTLARDGFGDMAAFLREVEAFWQVQLTAFKAFAEEHE